MKSIPMPHALREFADVAISEITTKPNPFEGMRRIQPHVVNALAASFKSCGLLHPVILRKKRRGKYYMISGRHRLLAAQQLGWTKIRAEIVDVDDDTAKLIQIDENLFVIKLSPAERMLLILEKDELQGEKETLMGKVDREGENATLVQRCAVFGDLKTEMRRFRVDEPRP